MEKKVRPCLNYQIGLCRSPCGGYISREDYRKIVLDIIDLLSGRGKTTLRALKEGMEEASENLEFEKAAVLRDKILAIEKITEKQKIITGNFEDEDFINIYSDEKDSCIQVFFLRDGKITGREHFVMENTSGIDKKEIISNFIKEFYGGYSIYSQNNICFQKLKIKNFYKNGLE